MVIPGRVQNGVVVLAEPASLPEGAEVTVVVHNEVPGRGDADELSEEERERMREALERLLAMPDENSGDTFSGADRGKGLDRKAALEILDRIAELPIEGPDEPFSGPGFSSNSEPPPAGALPTARARS